MSAGIVRVWAAIMHDGQPRAEVLDSTDPPMGGPEFRIWRWAVIRDEHEPAPNSDCAGPTCLPGHPCAGCQQMAVYWWYEWDRRSIARKWRATHENNRPQTGWKSSDWCSHEKGHPSEAAARKCARKGGFPRIVELDGHGKRLRWVDTVPAGALFGGGSP